MRRPLRGDAAGAWVLNHQEKTMNIASVMQGKNQLAKTADDYVKLLASNADWIVRSKEDFKALRQTGKGPLSKLEDADFTAFVDSLEYMHGGVAHGSYKPLMNA